MLPPESDLDAILESLPCVAGHEASAPMLPRDCYTSPEFFEFERTSVFARSWLCVGRVEQLAKPGDFLAVEAAGEPVILVRTDEGTIIAMSAICRHRGEVLVCESGSTRSFRCPLHFWTYDLEGRLIAAPRMGRGNEVAELRETTRLPRVRVELWHGFVFVNLDEKAASLAPSLAKLDPFWENYEAAGLIGVPPRPAETPLPWNWKIHIENFTDAYHPEFVHRGTHDFAPSNHPEGGVVFTEMGPEDNAIVRSVPLCKADGGMMSDGWGEDAVFPPITNLSPAQRKRLTFVVIPPSLTLVFAPAAVAYTLINPVGVAATFAASDRVTNGGWLLPQSTLDLPDFMERAAKLREGAAKIWAQDLPVNLAMQTGKRSRFHPNGIYGPLETTLLQFNAWLLRSYRAALSAR